MTDHKNKKDGRDRSRVAGGEEYELDYLAEKLHVSLDLIRQAIEVVGADREKVEAYLDKNA